MIYIIVILLFLTLFNLFLLYKNINSIKQIKNNYINLKQTEIQNINKKLEEEKNKLKEQEEKGEERLKSLQRTIDTARSQWETEYSIHQTQSSKRLKEWEESERVRSQLKLQNEYKEKLANEEANFNKTKEDLTIKINEILAQLLGYQAKQDAINEEIRRRRELEEQLDFYRIQLPDEVKEDIQILKSVRFNLHFRQNLDKLIYDSYISKPVNEMIKRVLKGQAPSGIYKITRLKTGEIYIGKSTDVKNRWQQHAKTAFNVGTIAHSILHTTMEKDGIENFTFELLEEVPKDELSAREKFYIEFYKSKEYGLNERDG